MPSNPEEFEELWTIREIADYFKINPKTVSRNIKKHNVPTIRIGRQIRVRASHIQLLVKKKW